MNNQILKGLLRNIQPSHKIGDIEYDQADLVASRSNGKDDIITLKFKKYSNKYKDGDIVELTGNIRSYSKKLDNGKNKVSLYVFTYFDLPDEEYTNHFQLDGRICKIEPLRKTQDGKVNIHFILANNLLIEDTNQKLNSYLPCIAWGNLARKIEQLHINDKVMLEGEFHSREYKKLISKDEFEFRVAHELVIQSFEVLEK